MGFFGFTSHIFQNSKNIFLFCSRLQFTAPVFRRRARASCCQLYVKILLSLNNTPEWQQVCLAWSPGISCNTGALQFFAANKVFNIQQKRAIWWINLTQIFQVVTQVSEFIRGAVLCFIKHAIAISRWSFLNTGNGGFSEEWVFLNKCYVPMKKIKTTLLVFADDACFRCFSTFFNSTKSCYDYQSVSVAYFKILCTSA